MIKNRFEIQVVKSPSKIEMIKNHHKIQVVKSPSEIQTIKNHLKSKLSKAHPKLYWTRYSYTDILNEYESDEILSDFPCVPSGFYEHLSAVNSINMPICV